MKRDDCTARLLEHAAEHLTLARNFEHNANDDKSLMAAVMRRAGAQARTDAGVCIAAANHLMGVSPE